MNNTTVLRELEEGIFAIAEPVELAPKFLELGIRDVSRCIGHAEAEEIAAGFLRISKQYDQLVGLKSDKVYEEVCKNATLTYLAQSGNQHNVPTEFEERLKSKNYYPTYALAPVILGERRDIFTEEVEKICNTMGEHCGVPIYQLNENTINAIVGAHFVPAPQDKS